MQEHAQARPSHELGPVPVLRPQRVGMPGRVSKPPVVVLKMTDVQLTKGPVVTR